jgi:hypothetical protein
MVKWRLSYNEHLQLAVNLRSTFFCGLRQNNELYFTAPLSITNYIVMSNHLLFRRPTKELVVSFLDV